MDKRLSLLLLTFFFAFGAKAQEKNIDTTAVLILDRMGAVFGDLNSIGFTSEVSKDVAYSDDFYIKVFSKSEVIIKGPNKFSVRHHGEKNEDIYSYDGSQVTYFSFANNIYAVADAPDNLIETIDYLYEDFGIELTTADFLYPNFSKDFVDQMDQVLYLGVAQINGKRALHVMGSNESISAQIWVSDDAYFLPMKIVITYLSEGVAHQHQTDFSDWALNMDYPDSIFEFLPPPNARQITWLKQN